MKALRGIMVLVIGLVLSSFSEVPYEWKDQKIQFKLPDFFLTEKTNDLEFVASGKAMDFQLNVYMDELVEEAELNAFVTKIAKEQFGLTQVDGGAEIVKKGFKGYYQTGLVDGELLYVLGLLDNDTGIAYYGLIKYNDADEADRTFARNIIASFEKFF